MCTNNTGLEYRAFASYGAVNHISVSTTSRLSVKADTSPGPRSRKAFTSPDLWQPHTTPHRLVTLTVRRHTHPRVHIPHFDLAIPPTTHQVLPRVAPIQAEDPAAVSRQVRDLLPRVGVVQADDAGVAGGGKEARAGREADGADGLEQAGEGVPQAARGVAEDVDGAGGVA